MALVEQPIQHFLFAVDQQFDPTASPPTGVFKVTAQSDGTSSLTADQLSNNFVAAFQQVSDLVVIKYGYTTVSVEDNLVGIAPLGVAGEQRASITILLDRQAPPLPGQDVKGQIHIPGPKNSIFTTTTGLGNTEVNIANAAVQAYLDLWTQGAILPGFVISDFQHVKDPSVVGNWSGKRTTRKSKKG